MKQLVNITAISFCKHTDQFIPLWYPAGRILLYLRNQFIHFKSVQIGYRDEAINDTYVPTYSIILRKCNKVMRNKNTQGYHQKSKIEKVHYKIRTCLITAKNFDTLFKIYPVKSKNFHPGAKLWIILKKGELHAWMWRK